MSGNTTSTVRRPDGAKRRKAQEKGARRGFRPSEDRSSRVTAPEAARQPATAGRCEAPAAQRQSRELAIPQRASGESRSPSTSTAAVRTVEADDPVDPGEVRTAMSVTVDPNPEVIERSEQFEKYQTLAVTSQSIPLCRDVIARLDAAEYAAENGNANLEELASLLRHFSDELDALAALAGESSP